MATISSVKPRAARPSGGSVMTETLSTCTAQSGHELHVAPEHLEILINLTLAMCSSGYYTGQCGSRETHFTQDTVKHLELARSFIIAYANLLANFSKYKSRGTGQPFQFHNWNKTRENAWHQPCTHTSWAGRMSSRARWYRAAPSVTL